MIDDRAARLAAQVGEAPKARNVYPPFIVQRCAHEIRRRDGTDREIVKRVKRSLHQVGGAYLTPTLRYDRLLARLAETEPGPDREVAVRSIVTEHASMRERSADLDGYYAALFDGIDDTDPSDPSTGVALVDLACGLNPLARGLMPIEIERYVACDIYLDMLRFIADASELLGSAIETLPCDLTAGPPDVPVDVVLLLKTLPCLDQLDPDAGCDLLTALARTATHVVVTYPVRSLGGADKGMREHYAATFHDLLDEVVRAVPAEVDVAQLDLPAELGYRLTFTC